MSEIFSDEIRRSEGSVPFAPGEGAEIANEVDKRIRSTTKLEHPPSFTQLLELSRKWYSLSAQKGFIEKILEPIRSDNPKINHSRQQLVEIDDKIRQLHHLFSEESGLIADNLSLEVLNRYFDKGHCLKERSLLARMPAIREFLSKCREIQMRRRLADIISGHRFSSLVANKEEVEAGGKIAAELLWQEDRRRALFPRCQ